MNRSVPLSKVLLLIVATAMFTAGVRLQGCKIPEWPVIGGGASHFIVLHEATKDNEAFGKLAVQLQDSSSEVSKQITAAGWKVWVLDDDNTVGSDQPNPLLVKLGVHGSIADARRELLCIAPGDKLVHKETLPPEATAATVLSIMQAKGKR
jgi:hypothetical protein